MSEETKPRFELPWGTLLPVLAALAGLIAQFRPLATSRPTAPAEKTLPVVALEDVDARLWQDPIAVAQKRRSALVADMSAGVVPKDSAQSHDISTLVSLIHQRATSERGRLFLLGVMIDAGPYSEQAQLRLRARQAVLEGLSESGFVPKDGEHIGYVTSPWPLPNENLKDIAVSIEKAGLLMPWEECEALESRERVFPPGTASVIVLWLPAANFDPVPLTRFAGLIDTLASDIRDKVEMKLLGPANSTGLQNMVREVRAPEWNSAPRAALDGVTILSARATAADNLLLYDPTPATGGTPGAGAKTVAQLLEAAVPRGLRDGLHFKRTTATDDIVLGELVKELGLRGVPIAQAGTTKQKPGPHIVLLTEWDTPYGRSLGTTFTAKAYNESVEEIFTRRASGKYRREGGPPRRIHSYRYLRGIDGQLPGDPTRESAEHAPANHSEARSSEETEGLNQADYRNPSHRAARRRHL